MILSPLRPGNAALAAMALVACGEAAPDRGPSAPSTPPAVPESEQPGPSAQPKPGMDDEAIAAFEARPATARDFVIKFGEPFIGFETRGNAVLVSDHTAGQRYAYVSQARREETGGDLVFSVPMQSAWEGDPPGGWRLTIESTSCNDEFSGEITAFTAWGEPTVQDAIREVRLKGCARIVGTPQRWPNGMEP